LRNSTNSEIGEADHWHGVKGKQNQGNKGIVIRVNISDYGKLGKNPIENNS